MSRLARRPRPHNERGARSTLAHMGIVPPGARERHTTDPHATSPWVSPRRERGRVPSPDPLHGTLGDPPVSCFTVWYPSPMVHCGSSPSASFTLYPPFSFPSTIISYPSALRFSPTLDIYPLFAKFAPSTPPALLRPVDENGALPTGLGFAPYSSRPVPPVLLRKGTVALICC